MGLKKLKESGQYQKVLIDFKQGKYNRFNKLDNPNEKIIEFKSH